MTHAFKPLNIFCCCTARFVSELVENPKDRFSHVVAQLFFCDFHDALMGFRGNKTIICSKLDNILRNIY